MTEKRRVWWRIHRVGVHVPGFASPRYVREKCPSVFPVQHGMLLDMASHGRQVMMPRARGR